MSLIARLANRFLAATAVLAFASAPVFAADVEGVLTMRWGDPLDTTGKAHVEQLQAEIVGKSGHVYPIDAAAALEAGQPLFAMNGKSVVASLGARQKSDGSFRSE